MLDGEAERRKLFNDDMMEGEGQGGDFEEDVVIGGQSEGVVGMRGGEGGTNYSFHNQYSNSQQNTNLRGTRNEMITGDMKNNIIRRYFENISDSTEVFLKSSF